MPGALSLSVMVNHGTAVLEPAHYAPEFGKVQPTQCLVVDLVGGKAITAFRWG
jgi:hypothetical protein